jgi:hypothetical protein
MNCISIVAMRRMRSEPYRYSISGVPKQWTGIVRFVIENGFLGAAARQRNAPHSFFTEPVVYRCLRTCVPFDTVAFGMVLSVRQLRLVTIQTLLPRVRPTGRMKKDTVIQCEPASSLNAPGQKSLQQWHAMTAFGERTQTTLQEIEKEFYS